jgi:hypothetical protein
MRGVCVLLLVVALAWGVGAAPLRVAVLSDAHMNIGTQLSCYGHTVTGDGQTAQLWCDSPIRLVEAAVAQLAAVEACPAALLIPGDSLPHAYSSGITAATALATFEKLQELVGTTFANCNRSATPIIALGNNDLLSSYPAPPARGQADPWLVQVAATLAVTQGLEPAARAFFTQSGFYSVDSASVGVRVVVLHTNYWSAKNSHTASDPDPAGGLAWLSSELTLAAGQGRPVWLLGHISSGVDHYSGAETWHAHLSAAYYAIIGPRLVDGTIRASFFGHEHAILERQAVPAASGLEGGAVRPVWLSGSVSPDKGNFPTVRMVSVDETSRAVVDVSDYVLRLPATGWTLLGGGSFASVYGPADNVTRLALALAGGALLASQYADRSASATPGVCVGGCIRTTVCDVAHLTQPEYAKCTSSLTRSDWSGTLGLVGGMVAVALVAMIVAVFWRRRQVLTQNRQLAFQWTESFDAFTDEVNVSDNEGDNV